jgi:hypothetical protein
MKSSGKSATVKVSNGKSCSSAERSTSANSSTVTLRRREAFLHIARRRFTTSCVVPSGM